MTILRCVIFAGLTGLAACTAGDLHEECKDHDDCPTGQVCSFEVCVDEGSVQGQVCREGRAYCDGACVDTVATLETCGGCEGCPAVEHAEALACNQGSCVYVCEDGWRDTDANTANGCECAPDVDCDCRPTGDEVCDGLDNDCDGGRDNVPDPVEGATWVRNCGTRPHATPASCGVEGCLFACDPGFHDRNGDMNDGCECESSPEVCDGQDNDCNGIIDDGNPAVLCPAPEGAEGACAGRACIYQCAEGRVDVDGDLRSGTEGTGCECAASGEEVCDLLDNDCDGLVDGDDPDLAAPLCSEQRGVCNGAVQQCRGAELLECGVVEYAASAVENGANFDEAFELHCDRVDNNCDGEIDEDCCAESGGLLLAGADREIRVGGAISGDEAGSLLAVSESGELGWFVAGVDLRGRVPRVSRIRLGEHDGRPGSATDHNGHVVFVASDGILHWRRLGFDFSPMASGELVLPSALRDPGRPLQSAVLTDGTIVLVGGTTAGAVWVRGSFDGQDLPSAGQILSEGAAVGSVITSSGTEVLIAAEYVEEREGRQFVARLDPEGRGIALGALTPLGPAPALALNNEGDFQAQVRPSVGIWLKDAEVRGVRVAPDDEPETVKLLELRIDSDAWTVAQSRQPLATGLDETWVDIHVVLSSANGLLVLTSYAQHLVVDGEAMLRHDAPIAEAATGKADAVQSVRGWAVLAPVLRNRAEVRSAGLAVWFVAADLSALCVPEE